MEKIIIITGVLGGIGQSIAKLYLSQNYQVIGLDRHSESNLDLAIDYYQLDLSQNSKVLKNQYQEILNQIPHLTLLVHVAAIQTNQSIDETNVSDPQQWDQVINVNLKSIYQLTQLSKNHLLQGQGNVVVISSIHSIATSTSISVYAISKAALNGLVRNFALEWGSDQIRVNGIAPGAIDTPMLQEGFIRRGNPKRVKKELESRHLMGRIGQPEDIAYAVEFLGDSRRSGFITGQTIIVDGGVSIRLSTEV